MSLTSSALTDSEYVRLAGELLAGIESTIDGWLQQDVIDIDTQRSGGLLELTLPDGSKIVVNTQPPLHEIWLAARSGGYHFRHVDGQWRDTRDGAEFHAVLSRCASEQGGQLLQFGATAS